MKNRKNITWIKGEEYCRWKGMSYEEYSKIVGSAGDLEIDLFNLIKLGDVIYCDSAADLLAFLETIPNAKDLYNLIHEGLKVRTFEQMRFDIDLKQLREFASDLEAYYEWLKENNYKDETIT